MPVKKTAGKKTATKSVAKTASTKHVSAAKVVEVKKPTVVVETKKTDRCECGDNCNCGGSCNCCCGLKIIILVLVILNLIISCVCCLGLCSNGDTTVVSGRSAWDLEALKVGGEENLQKLKNDLYGSEAYRQAQQESIDAYMNQLGIE